MLCDRHRGPLALLLVAVLVGLCAWYAHQASARAVGFARCQADPATFDGARVELSLWRVQDVGDGLYRVAKLERGVPVAGPTAGLEPGAVVSLVTHYDAARQVLVEEHRELHPRRAAKSWLGALGTLAFLAWSGASYRWRRGRLVACA